MNHTSTTGVLVVGGGPAGTAAAIRLARGGHKVTLIERRVGSWDRSRGDLHVPGAVAELADLGVIDRLWQPGDSADWAAPAHTLAGVRIWYRGRSIPLPWPSRSGAPAVVWPRTSFDTTMRAAATAAGVEVRLGTEATGPILERGFVRGAMIRRVNLHRTVDPAVTSPIIDHGSDGEIRCRFLVIADGARSRFGRSLGTHRDRRWPYAVTTGAYFASDRHDDRWSDIALAISGPNDVPITGHGWVNPVGDGRVSVGVNLLSSSRDILGINVVKLFDKFVGEVSQRWRFDPTAPLTEPARVRTPLGGSTSPKQGPTYLVVGDAAGMANPFNGLGTHAALFTGRICAEVLDEAMTVGNSTTLQQYPARLADELSEYHKVARLSARFLGRPGLLGVVAGLSMRSETTIGGALRIATGELRAGDDAGNAERCYRAATLVARFAPSW